MASGLALASASNIAMSGNSTAGYPFKPILRGISNLIIRGEGQVP